jgi:GNAT superfamily N-acetyltransferase
MSGAAYKYSKTLDFRAVNPARDAATLIAFGRDLYGESLAGDSSFLREFGAKGERFPIWIAGCAAANRDFAAFLTEDGMAIGMAVLGGAADERDVGHVHHFYMTPSHRGQGFGGLLDDYARVTLRRAGYARARLNVTTRNARAIRFYIAQGWRDVSGGARGKLRFFEVAL